MSEPWKRHALFGDDLHGEVVFFVLGGMGGEAGTWLLVRLLSRFFFSSLTAPFLPRSGGITCWLGDDKSAKTWAERWRNSRT